MAENFKEDDRSAARDMIQPNKRYGGVWFDVGCIVVLSVIAEMVFFSAPQGRAVISADSIQYVAAADALLNGDSIPHFEMRKPGFILWLWLVGAIAGNMGWAVIVANHALLATLPAGAYGFGVQLHSRALGWIAALATIAKLETAVWGNRMMSEALYTTLLTFGLLAACLAMKRWREPSRDREGTVTSTMSQPPLPHGRGSERFRVFDVYWLVSGTLLGLAWLTRGLAAAVIAAIVVVMIGGVILDFVQRRRGPLRCTLPIIVFVAPVMVLALFECALNDATAGRFATSTGTRGAVLLLRMTHHQGEVLPKTPEARRAQSWIPEREWGDAFVVSDVDVWVARHRALHVDGLNEWEYDALMGKVAAQLIARDPLAYAVSAGGMAFHHVVRLVEPRDLAGTEARRKPDRLQVDLKPAEIEEEEKTGTLRDLSEFPVVEGPVAAWWSMPEWPREKRDALIARMTAAAQTKAPFGGERIWASVRYWLTLPPLRTIITIMLPIAYGLPVGGLLMGLLWGRHRRGFALIAVVLLAEAALIGALVITSNRFVFVWIAIDSTLAGAAIVIPVAFLWKVVRPMVRHKHQRATEWSLAT